jgi:hypothetical protein
LEAITQNEAAPVKRQKKRCFNPTESAKPCDGLLTGYAEQTKNDPPVTLQVGGLKLSTHDLNATDEFCFALA